MLSAKTLIREMAGADADFDATRRSMESSSPVHLSMSRPGASTLPRKLAIHGEFVGLRDSGVSVVAVSSELEELCSLCDRILVLSNRKLVAEFQRNTWRQEDILAAAFSEFVSNEAVTNSLGA